MKKNYTFSEYYRRFSVDPSTVKKMGKLSLFQSRKSGENGIPWDEKRPLEFWRELQSKAEKSRIPSFFYSAPGYIRKNRTLQGVDPRAFYIFMKKNYKSFKSKHRHGDACDDLVFLFSDLQAGAKQFLNKAAGNVPQKRQETPAPEPNNTSSGNTTQGSISITVPERGERRISSAAEGHGLLGFMLGALSGAAVAVVCVVCCF